MDERIGILAGHVWHHLDEHGPAGFRQLREALAGIAGDGMTDVQIALAVGWLAREGKVRLSGAGTGRGFRLTVTLK